MDLGLTGKVAIVCGASRGLGHGCALALAEAGVDLVMVARGAEALHAAAGGIAQATGIVVTPVPADVTTREGRAAILAAAPAPDILVTNAEGPPPGDFRDWDEAVWLAALRANLLTPVELMKATVDGMAARGFGRVVNITSSAVKAPIALLGLSNAARGGLTGFVAGLARAMAGQGVTVNNLLPGRFDTARLRTTLAAQARRDGTTAEAAAQAARAAIPAGRFGDPREFGQACAFLCSAQAGYITGQNVLIDGGAYPGTF